MSEAWTFAKKYFPLIFIVLVFTIAIVIVARRPGMDVKPGTVVLRLGHWQLESGVKEAINKLADEYSKTHPNVKIIQDAIPESVYGQWLGTQFIGGTEPDMVQMGMLPYQRLIAYYNRYCLPLGNYVNAPNPYNKGTDLENVAWRQTFKDGLRGGYIQELQEYMAIPLSQTAIRVFYNKNLLKKLTGLDAPPRNYRDFYNACLKIKAQENANGSNYIPLAGSMYHFGLWTNSLCDIMTYPNLFKADYNYDGYVSTDEFFVALLAGNVSFKSPPVEARFKMIRELADLCQSGFTGLSRDDGVFLFIQQRAVFISSGTWDAGSLISQANGNFEVGVMDFPYPTKDDPEFGAVVYGPRYENPTAAFQFSITRTCKHPEIAIDFLRFITSKSANEELNRIICWIPAVNGAEEPELLRNFKANLRGVYSNFNTYLGGETWLRWEQLTSLYNVNRISYDNLAEDMENCMKTKGNQDYAELRRDWKRGMLNTERMLTGMKLKAVFSGKDNDWYIYRKQSMGRGLMTQINQSIQLSRLAGAADTAAPYEYTSEIIKSVEKELADEQAAKGK